MATVKIMSEEELIDVLGEDGLDEIEEAYDLDLSEGAEIIEIPEDKKATIRDIEKILDMDFEDASIPLIIVSPKGFTNEASDLAFEYEDVVLCTSVGEKWVPWEVSTE